MAPEVSAVKGWIGIMEYSKGKAHVCGQCRDITLWPFRLTKFKCTHCGADNEVD